MAFTEVPKLALVNIVGLGAPKVGKTAFIRRYLDSTFSADYQPTDIGYHTRQVVTADDNTQLVHIVEVSGRKEMSTERDKKIRGGDAFLVMYAVNDKKSLKKAIKICKRVYDIKESNEIPLTIIGHKTELKEDSGMKYKKRLSKVKKKLNAPHKDASARLNINIRPVFDGIIDLVHTKALHDDMLPRRDS